jgi:hypothetical protein
VRISSKPSPLMSPTIATEDPDMSKAASPRKDASALFRLMLAPYFKDPETGIGDKTVNETSNAIKAIATTFFILITTDKPN